jgi:CelD/BcsL family acetyltransferase involved in cellulose biosynthesis
MKLHRSDAAFRLLGDNSFRQFWQSLFEVCPWKTCYQSLAYVEAWYKNYRDSFEPLILCSFDHPKPSLLPLALGAHGLVVAGGRQAEYQAWLAPQCDSSFAYELIDSLNREINWERLTFKFLPPGLLSSALPRDHVLQESASRPLMKLDPIENINAWLKKISKKSKLSELQKQGNLIFEQLKNAAELEPYLDEIVEMYDFRQGAVHGILPFELDPRKRSFALAMADISRFTHCTVLRLGDRVIAAHLGRISGDTLHVGILAYSPVYARFSPAKVHLMMLARMLHDRSFRFIDLTPGGDEWKERFATDYDTVTLATLVRSRVTARKENLIRDAKRAAKSSLRFVGFSESSLHQITNAFSKKSPSFQKNTEKTRQTFVLYERPTAFVNALPSSEGRQIFVDRIGHLLRRDPRQNQGGRLRFLSSCLRRLESGNCHVFTRTENHRVVQSIWLAKDVRSLDSTGFTIQLNSAENGSLLFDLYCEEEFESEIDLRILLAPILLKLKQNSMSIRIYIPLGQALLAKAILSVGFRCAGTNVTANCLTPPAHTESSQQS